MKAAALSDLPVNTGRGLVVPLDPVHTEIVLAVNGAFGINERQCDKMSAVLMPKLQQRKPLQIDLRLSRFEHRCISRPLRTKFCGRNGKVAVLPKFSEFWRQEFFGSMYRAFYKFKRLFAKRQIDPAAGTK